MVTCNSQFSVHVLVASMFVSKNITHSFLSGHTWERHATLAFPGSTFCPSSYKHPHSASTHGNNIHGMHPPVKYGVWDILDL